MKKKWNYKKLLEMLENKKSLFKPLNKDFIKIKCCEFCRTFCRTTKFFKLKHQVSIFRNTWCSNGADGRNRTGTVFNHRRILSPVRLPVPPHLHKLNWLMPNDNSYYNM